MPISLILVFAVRLFCYQAKIDNFIGLNSSPIAKNQTVMALIAIWLQYTIVVLTVMRAYFNIKTINNIVRVIGAIAISKIQKKFIFGSYAPSINNSKCLRFRYWTKTSVTFTTCLHK